MSLVLDTGVLVAAARPWEADHEACRALLAGREQRVVPAPVLVEVAHILASTPAWPALLDDIVAGALTVADLSEGDYVRVRELQETYRDLAPGFVDAAVLAVVERLGEPALATLDERHFRALRPRHVDALRLLPADA